MITFGAIPTKVMRSVFLSMLAIFACACGPATDLGPVDIAVIGEDRELFGSDVRLSPAAQHLKAASQEGLVALDQSGQVVPALAERWIVTDDAMSYIFRLRNSDWPDGEPITAPQIRGLLQERFRQFEGTSLGLDLAKIIEVRAMTGRVIELRLSSPMPDFLRLLAQPELGLSLNGEGAGPMAVERDGDSSIARLSLLSPELRGFPAREGWEDFTRDLRVQSLPAREAVDAFSSGEFDLLLNGSIIDFPLIELGPLSRGAIQLDSALGLFGLIVRSDAGLLETAGRREALSMAIDREALIQPFGVGGWGSTTWIAPPELFGGDINTEGRWSQLTFEERQAVARRRIATWAAQSGEEPVIRVGLPEGPGGDLLFDALSAAWQQIGVKTERVEIGRGGDLELRDRLARYASPRWFLNQLNCTIETGLCSEEADELVLQSLTVRDPQAKQALLAEAHQILTEAEVFIPLGAPVRWSLVRGTVEGHQTNPWGLHPLSELAMPPN